MADLTPYPDIQKIFISSPSLFCGAYESDRVLINLALPTRQKNLKIKHTPYGSNQFVVAFKDETKRQNDETRTIKEYAYLWDTICIYLSILFGKRFDDHGFLEYYGLYSVPNFQEKQPIYNTNIGPYNHNARKDLGIALNLTEVKRIESLFYNESLNPRFLRFLYTALQEIETTCPSGAKKAKVIKKRLYQVKRKYILTITNLLNDYFFTNTEVEKGGEVYSLKQEDFQKRIKASYDLRSKYLHTGAKFGENLRPSRYLNEIPIIAGPPIGSADFMTDKNADEFKKAYVLSPTFIGLERIMRFCLLRFIHKNGIGIDERLGDNESI